MPTQRRRQTAEAKRGRCRSRSPPARGRARSSSRSPPARSPIRARVSRAPPARSPAARSRVRSTSPQPVRNPAPSRMQSPVTRTRARSSSRSPPVRSPRTPPTATKKSVLVKLERGVPQQQTRVKNKLLKRVYARPQSPSDYSQSMSNIEEESPPIVRSVRKMSAKQPTAVSSVATRYTQKVADPPSSATSETVVPLSVSATTPAVVAANSPAQLLWKYLNSA